jgi:hypothetical protein
VVGDEDAVIEAVVMVVSTPAVEVTVSSEDAWVQATAATATATNPRYRLPTGMIFVDRTALRPAFPLDALQWCVSYLESWPLITPLGTRLVWRLT